MGAQDLVREATEKLRQAMREEHYSEETVQATEVYLENGHYKVGCLTPDADERERLMAQFREAGVMYEPTPYV